MVDIVQIGCQTFKNESGKISIQCENQVPLGEVYDFLFSVISSISEVISKETKKIEPSNREDKNDE